MRIAGIICAIWGILVFLWWAQTSPESAPQQAAAAAQALVLAGIPYMVVSLLLRSAATIMKPD
jgi:hypothetical protein